MILFLHMGEHRLTSQTLNVLIPISMDILPIGQGSSDDNNSAPFSWVNFKGLSAEDQVFCKVPIQQLGFTAVLQHFRSRNSTYGGSLSARSLDKISDARRQKRPLVRVLAGWSSDSRGIDDHEPIEKTMIPRLDHGTIWFYDLWCVLYIYIYYLCFKPSSSKDFSSIALLVHAVSSMRATCSFCPYACCSKLTLTVTSWKLKRILYVVISY